MRKCPKCKYVDPAAVRADKKWKKTLKRRRKTIDVTADTVMSPGDRAVEQWLVDGTIPVLEVSASHLTGGPLDGKKRKKEKR